MAFPCRNSLTALSPSMATLATYIAIYAHWLLALQEGEPPVHCQIACCPHLTCCLGASVTVAWSVARAPQPLSTQLVVTLAIATRAGHQLQVRGIRLFFMQGREEAAEGLASALCSILGWPRVRSRRDTGEVFPEVNLTAYAGPLDSSSTLPHRPALDLGLNAATLQSIVSPAMAPHPYMADSSFN